MSHSKTTSAYDAFQSVDAQVSKPVVGSDGAKSWQNFQASDRAFVSRGIGPKAPLKKADRGIASTWEQERGLELESRNGELSKGYTHFKKRENDNDDDGLTSKQRKQIESKTRPDKVQYYINAETFEGFKKDYVFTTRNQKTGYYWDGTDSWNELHGRPVVVVTSTAATSSTEKSATAPVEEEEGEPKKKRRKKNKPQAPVMIHDPNHPLEQIAARLQQQQRLPPGWQSAKDRTTGKLYYFNRITSQRQWEAPIISTTAPVVAEEQSLPAGWSAAQDATSGKTYYYHAETKETRWERPADA